MSTSLTTVVTDYMELSSFEFFKYKVVITENEENGSSTEMNSKKPFHKDQALRELRSILDELDDSPSIMTRFGEQVLQHEKQGNNLNITLTRKKDTVVITCIPFQKG